MIKPFYNIIITIFLAITMSTSYKKDIWYNYWMPDYITDEPNYYDSNEFDWAKAVIEKKDAIKNGLLAILEERGGQLIPYYSDAVSTDGNQWATLGFKTWGINVPENLAKAPTCLLYTSPSPRDRSLSRMPSSA